MSSSVDRICRSQISPQPNSRKLPKTFRKLKNYTAKLAEFVLQWHDLEDYFRSIKTQLEELENIHKTDAPQLPKPSIQSQNNISEFEIKDYNTKLPTVQSQDENAKSRNDSAPIDSGKSLVVYLKDHKLSKDAAYEAIKSTPNSAKQVLEALTLFYQSHSSKDIIGIDFGVIRSNCIILLEELRRVGCLVQSEVRKEAMEMALDWKSKMKNASEVLGFLMLVVAFGIVDEFEKDEILKHLEKILQRKQAPELFRAFGLSEKANDFIQKLIDKNKRLEAVHVIYAFELVDKFPPVPLLKAHYVYAEETCLRICEKEGNSDDATDKQLLGALRGILSAIKKYKLQSEYSPGIIRKQIQQLKKKKYDEKKAAETSPRTVVHPHEQQIGNKRDADAPSNAQLNQHNNTYKKLRTVEPSDPSPIAAPRTSVNSKSPSFFHRGEERPNISHSSGITAPASNAACASTSPTLTRRWMHSPHVLPGSSPVLGQGAQQLIPSPELYNFPGSPYVTAPYNFRGSVYGTMGYAHDRLENGFGVSAPFNSHFASTDGEYGLSYGPDVSFFASQYRPYITETRHFGRASSSYYNWHGY